MAVVTKPKAPTGRRREGHPDALRGEVSALVLDQYPSVAE
jgi:hypothetical protein